MFVTHLFYAEGSRPGQAFPWCEKENANQGKSDGQCGSCLVTKSIAEATCPYCHHTFLKEMYRTTPGLPKEPLRLVHWGVHPIFSRDGAARLLFWEAACGEIDIHSKTCFATRNKSEITCPSCHDAKV